MGDIFLSEQEQNEVQKLYAVFLRDVRSQKLVPYLYSHQIFGQREKQLIDAETTDWAKNDRLYEIVLSRATYPNVCAMREALIQSYDDKHALIARMLPCRDSYAVPRTTSNQLGWYANASAERLREISPSQRSHPAGRSVNDGDDYHGEPREVPYQYQHPVNRLPEMSNQPYPHTHGLDPRNIPCPAPPADTNRYPATSFSDTIPHDVNRFANRNNAYSHNMPPQQQSNWQHCVQGHLQQTHAPNGDMMLNVGRKQQTTNQHNPTHQGLEGMEWHESASVASGNHISRSVAETSRQESLASGHSFMDHNSSTATGLGIYKSEHGKHGKGLCVIISNFTHDLPGYKRDVKAITDFFQGVLDYQILSFKNLNRETFIGTLGEVQGYLNQMFSQIDRLVVFVLSHGDEYGIKTCDDEIGKKEEGKDAEGKPIRVTAQEIVNMFTHDKVPNMLGKPKCFFLQHCRGPETVRAAAEVEEDSQLPPQPTAVGADTAMFYAANLGCKSFVIDEKGSWFIEETIRLMRRHHDNEHLVDIMGGVNKALSTKCDSQANGSLAYQMPSIVHSLTEKFYLTVPPHM